MATLGLIISHQFEKPQLSLKTLFKEAEIYSLRNPYYPDWLDIKNKRFIFHWGLGPVLTNFSKKFISDNLFSFLSQSNIELFSFDLGPSAIKHCGILPLAPPLSSDNIKRLTEKSISLVRKNYFGPLAVENYNYYPTGLYKFITEPDFINNYLEEFDLGLTLDLAHAAVTAHNKGIDPLKYMISLPLEKVVEIHISRPWLPNNPKLWAVDAHLPPENREWMWLKNLLDLNKIKANTPIFIEYYKDISKLKVAQQKLKEIILSEKKYENN